MSLFDLNGKVAIITGSSRGIGKSIATELARHGAKVAISSRNQNACDEVCAQINEEFGPNSAIAIAATISSKEALQNLVDETNKEFGRIDILVCNAATNPYYGSIDGISDDAFRKILDNNILSNHWLMQMVLPQMRSRNDGAIIVISSIGGLRGSDTIGVYNISKAADFQLVRNYAVENGKYNIRINAIAPGLIKTDFARALWEDPKAAASLLGDLPLARLGEPEDIAGAAVFLASKAGAYMSGQMMVIDGGATI